MNNILASTVTRRNLMKAFNAARKANVFDPGRLNRALGIVQANATRLLPNGKLNVEINAWHQATVNSCDCEDNKRGHICKHRIAKMLVVKATRLQENK